MPIIKSAKKSLRQDRKKRKINRGIKDNIKQLTKKYLLTITTKNKDKINQQFILLQKAIDKATKNKILKKNTANRRKSKFASKMLTK
ncbi:MAG: 30S ribosomal protein S20 [Candidatus Aenigmarchaeota archaeon]|nr:30S ribosomal protein S20 [Candidatus Aenigmarchaeota archaeon]